MTRSEAKRRVCRSAAIILGPEQSENEWLGKDDQGLELPEADARRMREAFENLCAELERRGRPRNHGPKGRI